MSEKFKCLLDLKKKLLSSFSEYLPPSSEIDSFEVGYLEGRKQTKRWMISEKDITEMYESEGDEITLWCDGRDVTRKRKDLEDSSSQVPASKHAKTSHHESLVEELAQELSTLHGDKFNFMYGHYKIWARMIVTKQYTDKNTPPSIPILTGKGEKKSKKDFSDTVADCAVAIVRALSPENQATCSNPTAHTSPDKISPSKKANLRSQYLSQLRTLQNLRDDGVLTQDEFQHEKLVILDSLKSLV